jgi:hypothetical protein
MAGRGPQSFKKRQREQLRKEKQEEKRAKRVERKASDPVADDDLEPNPILLELAGYKYEDDEPEGAKEKSAGDVL